MSDAKIQTDSKGNAIVRSSSGELFLTDPAHAATLVAQGEYSPATTEQIAEHNDVQRGGALGAAGRGAATGVANAALAAPKLVTGLGAAAFGVKDPLADYSGSGLVQDIGTATRHAGGQGIGAAEDESRSQMLADREVHPWARGAGELAGTIAGAAPLGGLATGLGRAGAGALGLAGRTATVAGGIGASVLEGGAFGATAAAEEGWVKNAPVTAEQTLAGIGLGSLFGLGIGGTVAVGGAGLSKLLGRRAATEGAASLEGTAARLEGEAAAREGSVLAEEVALRTAPLEAVSDGARGRARSYISGLADDAAVSSVSRGQQPALKALGGGKPASAALRAEAGKFLNESGIVGLGSDSAALERAAMVSEASGKRIGKVMERLDRDAPYIDGAPLIRKLDDLEGALRQEAWSPEAEQLGNYLSKRTEKVRDLAGNGILSHADLWDYRKELDALSKWGSKAPGRTPEMIREARAVVEGQLEQAVTSGGGAGLGAEYLDAKKAYRFSTWAKTTLEERVNRDSANRLFSLTDNIGAAAALTTTGNPLIALAAGLGNKLARERGMSTFAVLARKAAGDAVDLSAAPAAALGTARNVRTMVAHAESRLGSSLGKFLGTGEESGSIARRGAVSWASRIRADDADSARAAYKDHASQVQAVAANPQLASDRLNGITGHGLSEVAPGLQMAMAAVAGRSAQYLSAHLPCPPNDPNSITPQLDTPPPASASDLSAYADRVEGVEDPLSLVEDLHKGMVSPEKVDAVKTVWPQIFARIQQATMLALSERTEPVPYEQRKLLDIALDAKGAIEPSMRPASLQVMRHAFDTVQKQTQEQKPRGNQPPKVGAMLATRSQQISKGM